MSAFSTVAQISNGGLAGLSVHLIGDSGSRWFYAHLDELAELEVGDRVLAGEVVGTNGDSGNARGSPHLHLQWAPEGGSEWANPYPVLVELFGAATPPPLGSYGPPNQGG